MKINVSRISPNQWKRSSQQQGFWKSTWLLKILVVSESKARKQGAKNGENFHKNKCLQNCTKSMVKVTLSKEIKKIILDVENGGS